MPNFINPENGGSGQKTSTPPKADYRKYQDPTGEFDSNKLQFSLWYIQNRVLLYRLLLFLIGVIGGVLWLYSLVQWTMFFIGYSMQKQVEASLSTGVNYAAMQQRFSPIPLQVEYNMLVPGGVKKMDAVSRVLNPNRNFIAKIKYNFLVNGEKMPQGEATILPGQSTFVVSLGLDLPAGSQDIVLQMDKPAWERVPPHKIVDPLAYQDERLRFDPNSFVFFPANSDLPVNRLVFSLTNNSAYGYRSPKFYVAMYSSNALVGITQFQTEDLKPQETKEIDLRSFVQNLMVQKIEIYPIINVYDDAVYLAPPNK